MGCFTIFEFLPDFSTFWWGFHQNLGIFGELPQTYEIDDTSVIKILASADLEDLDFQLRDKNGKTPFGYVNEREVLVDAELDVHESFNRWAAQFQR